jgi:hypothetical protein
MLIMVQNKLVEQRDKNDQLIALLRKELKKGRMSLEAATHCDEVEASALVSLIEGKSSPPRRRSRTLPSALGLDLGEPFDPTSPDGSLPSASRPRSRSPARARASTALYAIPFVSGNAQERVAQRLARLNHQLAEENRGAPPAPRNTATNPSVGTSTTQKAPQLGIHPNGGLLDFSSDFGTKDKKGKPEVKSEFRTSADSEAAMVARSDGTGLARKSTWSRVFPGMYKG